MTKMFDNINCIDFHEIENSLLKMRKHLALLAAGLAVCIFLAAHYKTLVRYINFEDKGMVLGYGCGTPGMTKEAGSCKMSTRWEDRYRIQKSGGVQMKKIVILSASPRKGGNSDILCHQFMKGSEEAGNQTELISLYDKDIGFCKACYACFKTGKCVIQDDMQEILDKVQSSDVLVIATPTYFLTMNGVLKTTIDRFLPKWKKLGGHDVYLIITGHDGKQGLELVGEELSRIFCNLGNNIKGIVWGEGVWKKGEVEGTEAMEEAYRMGLNL